MGIIEAAAEAYKINNFRRISEHLILLGEILKWKRNNHHDSTGGHEYQTKKLLDEEKKKYSFEDRVIARLDMLLLKCDEMLGGEVGENPWDKKHVSNADLAMKITEGSGRIESGIESLKDNVSALSGQIEDAENNLRNSIDDPAWR